MKHRSPMVHECIPTGAIKNGVRFIIKLGLGNSIGYTINCLEVHDNQNPDIAVSRFFPIFLERVSRETEDC